VAATTKLWPCFLTARRHLLIGAVRAAELLQHLVGRPRQLERDVQPLLDVLEARVGVQRDAARRGVGDDGDRLLPRQKVGLLVDVDLVTWWGDRDRARGEGT